MPCSSIEHGCHGYTYAFAPFIFIWKNSELKMIFPRAYIIIIAINLHAYKSGLLMQMHLVEYLN